MKGTSHRRAKSLQGNRHLQVDGGAQWPPLGIFAGIYQHGPPIIIYCQRTAVGRPYSYATSISD